ncbi:hypothetical protein ACWY4P_52415 [Streptomyces sp. LZ34]
MATAIYRELGGVALGMHLMREFAATEHEVSIPNFRIIPIDVTPRKLVQEVAATASDFNAGIALRYSGLREAFSRESRRGVNSTGLRYSHQMILQGHFDLLSASGLLARAPRGTVSLVLQEMITGSDFIGPVHCYCRDHDITLEIRRRHAGRLIHKTGDDSCHDEVTDIAHPTQGDEDIAIRSVLRTARAMRSAVGFDLDIEGFWTGGRLVVLQLRPIPSDLPVDSDFTSTVESLRDGIHHFTRFVWGAFDLTGRIAPDITSGSPLVTWTDHERAQGWENIPRELGRKLPLIVDMDSGFHLSHDQALLPPAGPLRNSFRYVSVAGWPQKADLIGSRVRCVSDGEMGVVRIEDRSG